MYIMARRQKRLGFAAVQNDAIGPSRHFAALRNLVAFGAIADLASRTPWKIYGFTA
jgi:hypothetical protein